MDIKKITNGNNKAKERHSVDLLKHSEEFYSSIPGPDANRPRERTDKAVATPGSSGKPQQQRPRRPQNEQGGGAVTP
tara:strand:+ start:248 stop:478 length:231 start_codon:yes stop_codon:yes gene_type:complete